MLKLAEMQKIVRDVGLDREPSGYTDEMLDWRERLVAEWEAFKAKHPEAFLDVATDLDGIPGEDEPEPAEPAPA